MFGDILKIYKPYQKPSGKLCPKEFCFEWGSLDSTEFVNHQCCSFSKCIRTTKKSDDEDCYEPNEPLLFKNGLPWFYFIPNPKTVIDKEKYILESEAFWGKEHWIYSER